MTDQSAAPAPESVKITPNIVSPVSRDEARKRREEQRRIEKEKAELLAQYEQEAEQDLEFENKLREKEALRRDWLERVKQTEARNADITQENERRKGLQKRLILSGVGALLVAGILLALKLTFMAGW